MNNLQYQCEKVKHYTWGPYTYTIKNNLTFYNKFHGRSAGLPRLGTRL